MCISYSLAYLKYLNKYVLTTNVSAYVKYVNTLCVRAIYRNFINYFYSGLYILSIIFLIWTIYTFSVKSCYSYLNIFSILLPIISLYRLTIVILYRHLYIKYIEITYNITYKGSLYFAIPDVRVT